MMNRKLLIGIVGLAMVTVYTPATVADHLSVGASDSIGTAPRESPADPSVVGEVVGANDTPYGVGTKTAEECYEASADLTADEALAAASSRGFCGMLRYNDGSSAYEVESPPDQDIRRDDIIGDFDVMRTWPVANAVGFTCEPMCNTTGQNALWNAFHDAGKELGFTDGPSEADDKRDGERAQTTGFRVEMAAPMVLAQQTAEVWDMNGWSTPGPIADAFVGYLYDNNGEAITNETLEAKVSELITAGELHPDTTAQICGFTPDRNFQSTGEQSFCELPLLYVHADADSGTRFDGYNDECESPTYVCGAIAGGYWESESIGLAGAYAGRYQGEHTRWHWVIAPHKHECGNTEPGPHFQTDQAEHPYLAHDLDVYTPPQAFEGVGDTVSTEGAIAYAEAFTESTGVPGLPAPVEEALAEGQDLAEDIVGPYTRADRVEPNYGVAIEGIAENSQQAINEARGLGTDCDKIVSEETLDTTDPWVNIIDATTDTNREFSYRDPVVDTRTPMELARDTDTVGLYGNDDQSQDASNDPTPDRYATEGMLGVFTDKDDDGAYEQVTGPEASASTFGAGVYDEANIQATGAYPMLWDMHVEVDEQNNEVAIAKDEGCVFTGDKEFGEVMKISGYGPNTGLVQAIYLGQPTEFTYLDTEDGDVLTVPYPEGNNIYVLMNQAAREIWDGDGDVNAPSAFPLDAEIDQFVTSLENHVIDVYGADESSLDVVQPGGELELDTDFDEQCGESTGGFDSLLSFTHHCTPSCAGDTIATMYSYEVASEEGTLGGEDIPFLKIDGEAFDFGAGQQHTWYDIDPFDGDADRNDDGTERPPTAD